MTNQSFSGSQARAVRQACRVSQASVAAAIGINRTYLSLFECGRYVLTEHYLEALRDYYGSLGWSDDDKCDGAGVSVKGFPVPQSEEGEISDDAERLQAEYAQMELEDLRPEIQELLGTKVKPGFLWGVNEEDRFEKTGRALCLLARAYKLTEESIGNDVFRLMPEEEGRDRRPLVVDFVKQALSDGNFQPIE